MKIYTEVNYEWKDGELVKTSSKSFEYSGDIALCGGGGGWKKSWGQRLHSGLDDTLDIARDPAATIEGGPKGSIGQVVDKLYGGSTKDLMEGAQGKTEEEEVAPPELLAEEVDPEAALTAQNQKRKQEQGRGAANLTAGQSATMLTS